LDTASEYLSLDEPDRSSHLWRYTPWRRVHPTGDVACIPEVGSPSLRLTDLDGNAAPNGIRLEKGIVPFSGLPQNDPITNSFLQAASAGSQWTLIIDPNFSSIGPLLLDIDSGDSSSALHLSLDVGRLSELEIITRVTGCSEWFGLLRTGEIGGGAILNDVVACTKDKGTLLRVDSISLGRDARVRAGTASFGSERTKADLRYMMGESGSDLRVLGSILSADTMQLDHHVEIYHDAPETFSRLAWHSVCGGCSRTVGTGMLRIADGSRGADASQTFHNLLLSKDAEADSIPELEVLEHEVVGCGHGTANGPIDQDQLFYLGARGLDPSDARIALITAFLNSTLSEMGSSTLHDWLVELLVGELESLVLDPLEN
jgi:Fe-S cluster assembly protein SufD|tara:strand:- start:618 stop:1736 length:1119 start_codon:yes stop_codon:yes gene_type:complete